MSLNDIRSFEGQSWAALAKCIEKEQVAQKKSPGYVDPQNVSNSICLNSEDIALYGKYPGSESFILALCGYCGDRFKVPALARHLALRHPDGKVSESNERSSQKGEAKSPNNLIKKNKVKLKKESNESTAQAGPLKLNQQPSKVLIQVDRRKVPYSTSRDPLFISKHYIENHDDSLNNLFKNDKDVAPKTEISKVKKPRDDFDYSSSYKQNSPKPMVNGNMDTGDSTFFPRSKEKVESKKHKKSSEPVDELERDRVKVLDKLPGESIMHIENGYIDNLSDEGNLDIKRQKLIAKTKLYNPDRHCGVIGKENSKPCTRPLTCKSHTMSLRRAVRGRSKNFDQLLADHHAEKEASKLNINDSPRDISMSPEIIKKLQLTPIKIPLVLNPHLTKVDPVIDVINCNSISNKAINGVRLNSEINSDVMNNINKINHFQPNNNISRNKIKKKRKKRKFNNVKKSQVKCFSQWHPWCRKIGGLLYTQNNLPTFTVINNIKKKPKPMFTDKKPNARYNMKIFRSFNSSNCVRRIVKSSEFDHRDWTIDFRLHNICLRNSSSTQVYNLEDVKDVYFKLIPESKLSSILRIRNESLAITFPPSSFSFLANPLNSENQFLVQKKRDYPYIHKYIYSYNNSEDSSSDSDCDDLVFFDDVTDIRYSMMEPVKTNKEVTYSNHITLAPLSGHPLRNHRFPSRPDERNFNLGIGTLNDGQVCLETINRLHFVTPSGPMAVALKQHPVISEGSYNLVKSLVEE